MHLLHISNLQIAFETELGTSVAVQDSSFTVDRGEVVAIVGESGSGKSVTSLSILQLLPSKTVRYPKGSILFSSDGEDAINILDLKEAELRNIRGSQISMIFQEPMTSLNPVFTCGEQVIEAILQHTSVSKAIAREQTLDLFRKVKLPDPESIFKRYPHQLSGGQKQRVMIAMAMSCKPDLLICDEPTTALDVTVQQTILELLKELQQTHNMGIIFITHDLGVVAQIADRAIVMYKGAIVDQGPVKQLFTNPGHPYTKALLACRPALHPKGHQLPVVSDFLDENGKEKNLPFSTSEKEPVPIYSLEKKEPLLQIQDLSIHFTVSKNLLGKTRRVLKAVDGISFDVLTGETLGLVGESGCGKTTLGRALLGLIPATSGKISYQGRDLTSINKNDWKRLRKDVQIIFQDPYSSLNPRLTIGEAIAEPLKVHGLESSSTNRKEKVVALLEKVGLSSSHFQRYPHEFSGGQRQRIVIARALALEPSFVVCDESVSALDVSVQAQVLNLLNDLKKEFGFTVVFISHDLSVVKYISDRILVMNKGQLEEIGEASSIYSRPQKAYTQKLLAALPKISF